LGLVILLFVFAEAHMESGKFEHRRALKTELLALWTWVKINLSDDVRTKNAALVTELDDLLEDGDDDFSWLQCNSAELLILPLLPEAALDAQLQRKLAQALADGAIPAEQCKVIAGRLLAQGVGIEVKREGMRALLSQLHQYYVNRRFRRDQRANVAGVLKWFAICILALSIVPIAIFAGSGSSYLPDQSALMKSSIFCAGSAWCSASSAHSSVALPLSRAVWRRSATSKFSIHSPHTSFSCVVRPACSEP
jgi:hypothetical protein